MNIHDVTVAFEKELCRYTGAKHAICVDNMSNALWLCLMYNKVNGTPVHIPSHTYPSVPCEIILAGGKVVFHASPMLLTGMYQLAPYPIWDCALRFTADMYIQEQFMCLSFTGAYKHLKLGKGGAILCDSDHANTWFRRARNSGRSDVSYHNDNFQMIGRNCYMHPSVSALGLQLIQQFYNTDGSKKHNEDVTLPYPDLSKFPVYSKPMFEAL